MSNIDRLNDLTLDEIIPIYEHIDGWFAFYLYNNVYIKNYMVNTINDYVGNRFFYKGTNYTFLQEIQIFILNKKHQAEIDLDFYERTNMLIEIRLFKNGYSFNSFKIKKEVSKNIYIDSNKIFIEGFIKDLIIFDIDFDKNSNDDIIKKHKYLVSNIRKLYLKQSKKYHPDMIDGNIEKFQKIVNCYEKLNKN